MLQAPLQLSVDKMCLFSFEDDLTVMLSRAAACKYVTCASVETDYMEQPVTMDAVTAIRNP